ncbi:hypothetical protein PSYJA_21667 [Pseudomonas syringae pv. japonica str. M301072]|uniref:Uncharacterized protein n=1 Tax=Pseudomonas syringae pv. japonica str. M301072 TaxID=629262 RepID=F3FMK1_PSESX|nr:hypothetical protein PSYJA_21667 [Pseudomonas syringae pv. japonica str. M301072]
MIGYQCSEGLGCGADGSLNSVNSSSGATRMYSMTSM